MAGSSARVGGPGGGRPAGGALGRASDAPTACLQHADVGTYNLLLGAAVNCIVIECIDHQ